MPREITDEMKESYIDYAMSVIISRALPDVRDGLKPVHRRILYAMYEDSLTHNAKFRKSASVIGAVLARYHPHGDMAVYDALVRMAQDFSLRYPLVEGQGNFGSIDGDEPAAYRYTEARLSKIGEEMLKDIEKNTVDFVTNYDGTRKEPQVLPSPLPNLLINGALGIAVGMATNIPPHNLSEVANALIYLVDNPNADTEDLFQFIKGPDFPTGGEIYNQKEIIQAYSQGKGPILMRGRAEVTTDKKGRPQIIIREIPFQVQKSAFLEQLAILVQEKRIVGIKDIRDESDKEGLRIVLDLSRDSLPQKVLNQLFKFSDLQKTFHLNILALVDGIQPKILSLAELLSYFIEHRKQVVIRKIKFDLEKAGARAHILEGLEKCLGKVDKVIALIKTSANRQEAKKKLMKAFKLDEIQAEAILETKLAQLAKLERKKIEEELKQIKIKIKELKEILESPKKIKGVIKKELEEIKENFGDERKTKVFVNKIGEISEEDLIMPEETIITLTRGGYIKRISPKNYRIQKRGGKGILGTKTVGEDIVEHLLVANTKDDLLFFTNSGKVFQTKAYEIPEGQRLSKGKGILNFLQISAEDKILALITIGKEEKSKYLVMATKNGIIKKTPLEDFENIRKTGLIAISLNKEDLLKAVRKSSGEDEIFLVTKKGKAIRFNEKKVRPMGRQASGVRAIKLEKGDEVVAMDVIGKQMLNGKPQVLIVTEKGYGKKSLLKEYRLQGRGGSGIKTAKVTLKTGNLISAKILNNEESLIVVSKRGQIIRTQIKQIPLLSRATQGVRIMRLNDNDTVASATWI